MLRLALGPRLRRYVCVCGMSASDCYMTASFTLWLLSQLLYSAATFTSGWKFFGTLCHMCLVRVVFAVSVGQAPSVLSGSPLSLPAAHPLLWLHPDDSLPLFLLPQLYFLPWGTHIIHLCLS